MTDATEGDVMPDGTFTFDGRRIPMSRTDTIALLSVISAAITGREAPIEGRQLVDATMALGFAIAMLNEAVTDRVFATVAADLLASAGM